MPLLCGKFGEFMIDGSVVLLVRNDDGLLALGYSLPD